MTEVFDAPQLVCVNHPQTVTSLRCNRCERPICTRCAVLTPTGYRCKDCIRGQQKVYETSLVQDYPIAFLIALVISFIGSFSTQIFSFFTIFVAPIIGVLIAEAVRAAVRKRRSQLMFRLATAGAAIGGIVLALVAALGVILAFTTGGTEFGLRSLLGLLWPSVYTFIVSSTVYYRLSGIQVR